MYSNRERKTSVCTATRARPLPTINHPNPTNDSSDQPSIPVPVVTLSDNESFLSVTNNVGEPLPASDNQLSLRDALADWSS